MKTAMLIGILFSLTTSGLIALSGYGTSAPVVNDTVDPSLSILCPNGGEIWYLGDTNAIIGSIEDTMVRPGATNCMTFS
ncbi:MAG: hypothetical protein Q8M98_11245 [Candidatus Cloacimonadaceae bacterium]|nr:hypothetical protein [Candidatus Cloacimonadaceae bacterium]MDP3115328.1 hypothetical protein [Candidatus Cloacimonadaceae bacterium]